jgi:hypothetical protein
MGKPAPEHTYIHTSVTAETYLPSRCLAMAPLFRPSGVMSQYAKCISFLERSFTTSQVTTEWRCGSYICLCEDILGSGCIAPPFLTSALDEGEWPASRPCRVTPGTHLIGGWVNPRTGLDHMEKRKILQCRESNPWRVALST